MITPGGAYERSFHRIVPYQKQTHQAGNACSKNFPPTMKLLNVYSHTRWASDIADLHYNGKST